VSVLSLQSLGAFIRQNKQLRFAQATKIHNIQSLIYSFLIVRTTT
jgi:hypothetical protein